MRKIWFVQVLESSWKYWFFLKNEYLRFDALIVFIYHSKYSCHKIIFIYFIITFAQLFALKVVTNEKQGGLGRWQMIGTGLVLWSCMFLFSLGRHLGKCVFPFPIFLVKWKGDIQSNIGSDGPSPLSWREHCLFVW